MSDVTSQITSKVFKTLSADAALQELLGNNRVFDKIPDRIEPPYVVLGSINATDWSTATEAGRVVSFAIHTWSDSADRREVSAIQSEVNRSITEDLQSLDSHHLVNLRMLFSETRREPISSHFHGLSRFRCVTEPKV